jgi:NAD(P)-dependent dehydrogenase (short-subunit alcohol dehydrogenase family)
MLLIDELARRHSGGDALVVNLLDAKLAAPNADFLSYSISKYALAGLGELAARALAESGIRVNAIAPALMLPSGEQDQENFSAVHELNPLRRGIEVADVIAALRYLIDSPGMTGQTLTLDGGQRFMSLPRDVQFLEQP